MRANDTRLATTHHRRSTGVGLAGLQVVLTAALLLPTPGVASGLVAALDRQLSRTEIVDAHARAFEMAQRPGDPFHVGDRVQAHLKADIAMAVAADALGDSRYATAARRDLAWVVRERLESDGGLNWDGPDNPYFFECHQHWFLIASELVARELPVGPDFAQEQRRVWSYLRGTNTAGSDFYLANFTTHGTFFAYRDLHRSGAFQSQAPFKGAYEIGAALWSLALHRNSSDLAPPGEVPYYLERLTTQIVRQPHHGGFASPEEAGWVRWLSYIDGEWDGYAPHDWKYALHLEEGALQFRLATQDAALDPWIGAELQYLIDHVTPSGQILTMPDGYGTAKYEYGQALGVLALGARAFALVDPDLSQACLLAADRVFDFAAQVFVPHSDEQSAVLLLGLAQTMSVLSETSPVEPSDPGASVVQILHAWPNPSSSGIWLRCGRPSEQSTQIHIFDSAGRLIRRLEYGSNRIHPVYWDGADERGHAVSAGRFWAAIGARGAEEIAPLSIVR